MINNQAFNIFVFFTYSGNTLTDSAWIAQNMPKITAKQAQDMILVAEWVRSQTEAGEIEKEIIFTKAARACCFYNDIKRNFIEK